MTYLEENPLFCNYNAEKDRILASLSAPMIALGLPSTIFKMETINNAYLMFKKYHKLVKFVSTFHEMGILEDCLRVGVAKGLISSPQQCTVKEFYAWATWLKTTQGQQSIHNAQLTKRLNKSVAQGETLEQAAIFRAFCMMKQDHGISLKSVNKEKDEVRRLHGGDELSKVLKNAEQKWEAEISKINADFGTVFAYDPPRKDEVDAAAYELYVADARAAGKVALEQNLFRIVIIDKYERKVYEAAEKRHANNPIYRKEIEAFLARKIVEFHNEYNNKGVKKVCHLLGIISGKEAVDDAIVAGKRASKKRTRP